MRKSLLSLAAVALLGSAAYAQDMDSVWAANPDFVSALSVTEGSVTMGPVVAHSGISGLISDKVNWTKNDVNYTSLTVAEGELIVEFTRDDRTTDFYGDFTADWATFVTGNGNKFGAGADTLYGNVWDATQSDVVIEAEYTLAISDPTGAGISTAQCRADVVDANARVGNQSSGAGSVPSGDLDASGDWNTVEWVFADQVYDQYTGAWWEHDPKAVPVADSVADMRTAMAYVPLDMTRITKLAFIIDHGATTADKQPIGKEVIFTFKNMKVGDGSFDISADPVSVEPTAADLGIYPVPATDVLNVPSAAVITDVLGQVVATGDDAIDVSDLPAGVYTVTVEEGSATIVVE